MTGLSVAAGQPVDTASWSPHAVTADFRAVPQVFFCDPPAGAVGLTADQAERTGHRIRVVDVDPGQQVPGSGLYADGYTGRARMVVDEDRVCLLGVTRPELWCPRRDPDDSCLVLSCRRGQDLRVIRLRDIWAALICASISWSRIAPPEQIPFPLAHATPHAVHLSCPQRERQAFWLDLAPCADFLRLRFLLQA